MYAIHMFFPLLCQVLAPSGMKKVICPHWKVGKHISVLTGVSATNVLIPPTLIFEGANVQSAWGATAPTLGYAADSAGYANEQIFFDYMIWFLEATEPEGGHVKNRRVLFFDQYFSHMSIRTLELLRSLNVVVVAMQPHTTHLFCVLDTSVFALFKRYLNVYFKQYDLNITQYNIAKYIKLALEKAMLPSVDEETGERTSSVEKGWKAAGLVPFSHAVMESSYVKAAEAFKAKAAAAKAAAGAGNVPDAPSKRLTAEERALIVADFAKQALEVKDAHDKGFNPLKAARAKSNSVIATGSEYIQAEKDKEAAALADAEDKKKKAEDRKAKAAGNKAAAEAAKAVRDERARQKAAGVAAAAEAAAAKDAAAKTAADVAAALAEAERSAEAAKKAAAAAKRPREVAPSAADGAFKPKKRARAE